MTGTERPSRRGHLSLPFGAFYGRTDIRHSAPGFELALLTADPHRVVERHSHDEAHFVLVLDGLYVSTAVDAATVSDGRALIFNPSGTTHRDRFDARGSVIDGRFLTLSVAPTLLDGLDMPLLERATALHARHALRLGESLAAACVAPGHDGALARESLALDLIGCVAHASTPHDAAPSWLHVAREHLDDRLGEPVRMSDIAAAAGVHPVHLARVFRAHLGMSPGGYLRRRRVEHARALLQGTSRTLTDIALTCGFTDQSHFTCAFKRATSMTPASYRRAAQGKASVRSTVEQVALR